MAELLYYDPTSETNKYRYAVTPKERSFALNAGRKEDVPKPNLERASTNIKEEIKNPKEEAMRLLIMYYNGIASSPIRLDDENARTRQTAIRKVVSAAKSGNLMPLLSHLENDKIINPELAKYYDILFPAKKVREENKVYKSIADAKNAGINGGFIWSKIHGGYIPASSSEGKEEALRR